jgi:hypothetical protein
MMQWDFNWASEQHQENPVQRSSLMILAFGSGKGTWLCNGVLAEF